MKLENLIVKAANDKSRDKPFIFEIGQSVRPCKHVLDDGQTREYWILEKSIVLNQVRTMLSKTNYYRLQHPNGAIDDFEQDELDHRFVKRSNLTSSNS